MAAGWRDSFVRQRNSERNLETKFLSKFFMKITKDTILRELLTNPRYQEILAKYNLPCLGCPFAKMEMESLKIGDICKMYGINLKALTKELNEL